MKQRTQTQTTPPPALSTHFLRYLLLITSAALAIRLIVFAATLHWIVFSIPIIDGAYYHESAMGILRGTWPGHEPYFMGPLYSYLLAGLYAVTGPHLITLRIVQIVLGVGLTALVGLLGRRLYSPVAGLGAALLVALYGPLVLFEQIPLLDFWIAVFATGLFAAALAWRRTGSWFVVVATGLLEGSLVSLRGTSALYAIPVLFVLSRRVLSRRGAVALAAALLVMTPFTLHNLQSGSRALLTTNLGLNFYIGNSARSQGTYYAPHGWDAREDPTGQKFVSRRSGRLVSPDASSRYWMRLAWAEIKARPSKWAQTLIRKAFLFLHPEEIPQIESFRFFIENVPIARVAWVGWWLLVPLAIVGSLANRPKRAALLLTGFASVPLFVTLVFFATSRYRLPAVPFLSILAGQGLAVIVSAPGRKRLLLSVATASAAIGLLVLPPPIHRDRFLSQDYSDLGLRYEENSDPNRAEPAYRQAVLIYPGNGDAWNNLGTLLEREARVDEALQAYERATEAEPWNPVPLANLGVLRGRQGDARGAEIPLRRALEMDPDNLDLRISLGSSLASQKKYEEATQVFEEVLQRDPSRSDVARMLEQTRSLAASHSGSSSP